MFRTNRSLQRVARKALFAAFFGGGIAAQAHAQEEPAALSLRLRWLDAAVIGQESKRPPSTPVCGWVIMNHLDESAMIFDTGGAALGSVVLPPDGPARWDPAPGSGQPLGALPDNVIANEWLLRMVKWLMAGTDDRGDKTLFRDFSSALEPDQNNLAAPDLPARQGSLAVLLGRPLALVRAAVSIQGQARQGRANGLRCEFRPTDRSNPSSGYWVEDGSDYAVGYQVPTADRLLAAGLPGPVVKQLAELEGQTFAGRASFLEAVDVLLGRVLLGEHRKTISDACERGPIFFATHSDPVANQSLVVTRGGAPSSNLWLPIDSPSQPQVVSLLLDPRGSVHATCAGLPGKSLKLPPVTYAAALEKIGATFRVGPTLDNPARIEMPAPDETGWNWNWTAPDSVLRPSSLAIVAGSSRNE